MLAISVSVPVVTWRDLLAGFIGFCLLPVVFVLIVAVFDP
jgi:hypothetical protein